MKQHQYPILSKTASQILAIPATSAPWERVFSVAGKIIAKERSRLDPTNAAELYFLHDVLPAIEQYDAGMASVKCGVDEGSIGARGFLAGCQRLHGCIGLN
jgi:hypothetical protein